MNEARRKLLHPTEHLVGASAFTSAGIVLQGYQKAGFAIGCGLDMDLGAAAILDANYKAPDGSSVTNFGHPDKPVDVTQISGSDIRAFTKKKFGTDDIALFEQGPSCQDFSPINKGGDAGRRGLMIMALSLIEEALPLTAVIEESSLFVADKHSDVREAYFEKVKKMPYRSAYIKRMNSIHYGSNQSRNRFVHIFVREDLEMDPIFPLPLATPPKRVRDFLPIDKFHSGHFCDKIKTKNDFMCTVTSGSPLWFYQDGKKWHPTEEELMLCDDLDPKVFKLVGTAQARKVALGNLMSPALGYEIGKTIREKILGYNRFENGLWMPNWM